jgi:hypothetical protein
VTHNCSNDLTDQLCVRQTENINERCCQRLMLLKSGRRDRLRKCLTSAHGLALQTFADLLDPPENPYVRDPLAGCGIAIAQAR